jgi:hypothetical protein
MKSEYTLGHDHFVYKIDEHFPKINSKIGVFLSGGMESTLVTLMAFELYGKENVLCFYSDRIFSGDNAHIDENIRGNVNRTAKVLGVEPIYFDADHELHISNRKKSVENIVEKLKVTYGIEYLLFGFTKLFFEVEPFKKEGLTVEQVKDLAFANPEKYKHTIEEFYLETGDYAEHLLDIDIPSEVYPVLRGVGDIILSPFKDLNKYEVVDLYSQLNVLDVVYKTSSCILEPLRLTGKHCGYCFNCQQRYDAFRIFGIEDKTEYESDLIYRRRKNLEELRNGLHN